MKALLIGLLVVSSMTANAFDCSFKITTKKFAKCYQYSDWSCYTINSSVLDEVAKALNSKGYTVEIADSTQSAELEIDLQMASQNTSPDHWGAINVTYVDSNRNNNGKIRLQTKNGKLRKVRRDLLRLEKNLPEFVSSLVQSCPK